MKRKWKMLWLVLCVGWIGVILLLSTHTSTESHGLSATVTRMLGYVLAPDFSSWSPTEQREWLSGMEQLVRKLAHIVEFGLLGVLVSMTARTFVSASARRKKPVKKMRLALACFYPCLAIAAVDEMVQLFSDGRQSSSSDVVLDCAGIIIGIALCLYKMKLPQAQTAATAMPAGHRRAG